MKRWYAASASMLFVAISVVALPALAQMNSGPLSDQELLRLLDGRTISGVNNERQPFTVAFKTDKTVWGTSVKKEDLSTPIVDDGTWRIRNSRMCITWAHWQQGEQCFGLFHDAAGQYRILDGRYATIR